MNRSEREGRGGGLDTHFAEGLRRWKTMAFGTKKMQATTSPASTSKTVDVKLQAPDAGGHFHRAVDIPESLVFDRGSTPSRREKC